MHDPDEHNRNGEYLLDSLVITNTLFKHRPCHQYTWFHPAERTGIGHMLDYMLVNRCFRSRILDTRIVRKKFLHSDHRLVVSTVRLKLKAKRRQTQLRPKQQSTLRWLQRSEVQEYEQTLAVAWEQVDGEENVECMCKC